METDKQVDSVVYIGVSGQINRLVKADLGRINRFYDRFTDG